MRKINFTSVYRLDVADIYSFFGNNFCLKYGYNGHYLYRYRDFTLSWDRMSKFDIACSLDMVKGFSKFHFSIFYEIYTYDELLDKFLGCLTLIGLE